MPPKQKLPKLIDMLINASENYNLIDIGGYQWDPESIRWAYSIAEEEYGDPLQYLNKGNILKEIVKSTVRASMGDKFKEEEKEFKKYEDFLERAYLGKTEETHAVKDSLYNILMEYENKYDFLTDKGQNIAKDVISRDLYSLPNIQKLYNKKYRKESESLAATR